VTRPTAVRVEPMVPRPYGPTVAKDDRWEGGGAAPDDPGAEDIDIHALLSAAVDKPPPDDLTDRVMSRLALMETVVEFGRLLGLVPVKVASDAMSRDTVEPDDEDDEDDEEDDDDS